MHPLEYDRYIALQPSLSAQANLDIQQPIVSTIKSKNVIQNDVFSVFDL